MRSTIVTTLDYDSGGNLIGRPGTDARRPDGPDDNVCLRFDESAHDRDGAALADDRLWIRLRRQPGDGEGRRSGA